MIGFDQFCGDWVNICIELRKKIPNKLKRTKVEGKKFEEHVLKNVLSWFVPSSYRIAYQRKIKGVDYKFDFLFVKSGVSDFYDVEPFETLAVFEVKSHGFFSYNAIRHVKSAFQNIERINAEIKIFYITFRETNTYDRKVKEIFADFCQNYYRLSDSGDGVQLPPKGYFPNEWSRLMEDLSKGTGKPYVDC